MVDPMCMDIAYRGIIRQKRNLITLKVENLQPHHNQHAVNTIYILVDHDNITDAL